ncbi:hypothetical protein [Alicyclobacillus contaminans]|uniref:hypothetical protein n=1 Tax=Alicyclobacillus contaminans TaxID=392016 RepID=UPI00054E0E8A|nr:hypothetical protein [Alicyclobacillus contaminans]
MVKNYHCCATCRHFAIVREHDKIQPRCTRLGYDTKTHYQFHCWDPRPDIAEKMKQQSVESPSSQEGSEHEGQAGG